MAKDLFSIQAADYARYRPTYPSELIDYIIGFVPEKNLAWDCATGNGQAAVLLSPYFRQIIATDSSEKQLLQAVPAENITYLPGKAEQTNFADNGFDLITIAQAYHWFQFRDFAREAKRIGKPGGIIAVWGYNIPACNDDVLNRLISHFYKEIIGPYWDAERKWVDDNYTSIPFPFQEIKTPAFAIKVNWSLQDLEGYFYTWSALQKYIAVNHSSPVDALITQIKPLWGNNEKREIIFPVHLRLGTINK